MTQLSTSEETLDTLYAILDSNILLHFEFIHQINWPSVLGVRHACLVLSPILFRELDDVKDGMTKPGRRALAQRVLKTLSEALETVPLDQATPLPGRPNTDILYTSEDDLAINGSLRHEKQDDHLIAAALHFIKQHPNDTVVLISDDFNCRQRAKRFGITACTLPETLKRPLPRTEEEERLRRLEALEPQVQIEFGAQHKVLSLPYTELIEQKNTTWTTYANQIGGVVRALEESYEDLVSSSERHSYYPTSSGQRPTKLFGGSDIEDYNPRDKKLIKTLRELDLSILEALLHPKPKVVDYHTRQATAAVRPEFERWQNDVLKLYELSGTREEALFLADQALAYYPVSIALTHTGGTGIEDGQIVVTLEAPFVLKTFRPLPPGNRLYNYMPPQTQWLSVPQTPSAREETPHKRAFKFGNLHPGKTLACDPLYIYVEVPDKAREGGVEPNLTVEISGLNVRTPIQETVLIRLA